MPPLSSSTNSCCKLFLRSHVWLRLKMVNESVSVLQSSSSHLFPVMPSPTLFMVDVGLTKRGLDDIGDITSIQIPSAFPKTLAEASQEEVTLPPLPVHAVKYGQEIVKLNWDAHLITGADELYHTVWETISETTTIVAPVDGELVAIHCKEDAEWVDEDTALFTLRTDGDLIDIHKKKNAWMQAEEYEEYVDSLENGKFFDPDQEA